MFSASYIIYISNSKIKAMNGNTGMIDFIGTDAASVIQNALDALYTGGKIFIKEGTYMIDSAIKIRRKGRFEANTIIEGESLATELKLDSGNTNDIIKITDDLGTSNFIIRNLKLNGNKSNCPSGGIGINLGTKIWNVLVENIYITDCQNYNIYANGGTTVTFRKIHTVYSNTGNLYSKGKNYRYDDIITEFGAANQWAAIIGNDAGTLTNIYVENCDYGLYLNGFDNSHAEGILTSAITKNYDLKIDYSSNATISGMHLGRADLNGYLVIDKYASDITIIGEGYTNVTDLAVNTRFIGANRSYITRSNVISDPFVIDSIGIKEITISHGLSIIPRVQDCYINVVENTIVDDWGFDLLKIISTDKTNVIVKINITKASTTVGATAKIALRA